MDFTKYIAIKEDWPKKGISFKDITPLLQDKNAFKEAVKEMANPFKNLGITKICCADARGFIFGAALAFEMNVGLVIARKPNKLPYVEFSETYDLEYGSNTLEIPPNAITKDDKVLICDDLLATGGSSIALTNLTKRAGGTLVGYTFLVELTGLKAKEKMERVPFFSLIKYEF